MPTCDLCDLSTPEPPVTREGVEGVFCCPGCLEVAGRLEELPDSAGTAPVEASGDGTDPVPTDADTGFVAVEGMHCGTCEAFVEATATEHEGVYAAEANYAAEVAKLTYDSDRLDTETLPSVIDGYGYVGRALDAERDADDGIPLRLIVGGLLGMGVMMWYALFLYPQYLGIGPADPAWSPINGATMVNLWVLTTVVLGYTGYPILRGAYVSLRTGRPNMDLLIALAAGNAYLYSTIAAALGGTEVYFDITVTIVLVVSLGSYYERRVKRRATEGLTRVTEERADRARRRTDTGTEQVPVSSLAGGDEVVVRSGERIPADGTVIDGTAAVDESLVTGEALPVEKEPGDAVLGGSLVTDDALVAAVDSDPTSTIDRLERRLWEVRTARPAVGRLADRLAAVFVPTVLTLGVGALAWQLATGAAFADALLVGLAVLVVACPCALGLATPLAVAAGVRTGLDRGVLLTDESVFERAPDVDTVAFDKTGTLTRGGMRVVDPADPEAMKRAAAVEARSSHPIAEAITNHTAPPDVTVQNFRTHPGIGVSGRVDGDRIRVGRQELFENAGWAVPTEIETRADAAREAGLVPVVIGWNGRARSLLTAGDRPRERWANTLETLSADREIVVITGDTGGAVETFRDHPAVDTVFAGVPPDGKAQAIDRLQRDETVAMVGDGTNDAPALAAADIGIAMGGGTALAAEAADVVVTDDDLASVPTAFEVVDTTRRRIRQNLGWAFLYNAIAVPAAVAGMINPIIAAGAMAASSLLVVVNSARRLV